MIPRWSSINGLRLPLQIDIWNGSDSTSLEIISTILAFLVASTSRWQYFLRRDGIPGLGGVPEKMVQWRSGGGTCLRNLRVSPLKLTIAEVNFRNSLSR